MGAVIVAVIIAGPWRAGTGPTERRSRSGRSLLKRGPGRDRSTRRRQRFQRRRHATARQGDLEPATSGPAASAPAAAPPGRVQQLAASITLRYDPSEVQDDRRPRVSPGGERWRLRAELSRQCGARHGRSQPQSESSERQAQRRSRVARAAGAGARREPVAAGHHQHLRRGSSATGRRDRRTAGAAPCAREGD